VSANTLPAVIEANTAIAPPTDLVKAARDFARASHAATTREAYAWWWEAFTSWCAGKGLATLPADPETVALWMTSLATGEGGRKPLARASINQALSALIFYHRDAGYWPSICATSSGSRPTSPSMCGTSPVAAEERPALTASARAGLRQYAVGAGESPRRGSNKRKDRKKEEKGARGT
jgi:hypothetical protein